jgi:DNA-binding MurR/RpiR family transcriptional regulator
MKVRNCPFLKSWPPTWTRVDGTGEPTLAGEVGTLRGASRSRVSPSTACYMVMNFQDASYMATLRFEDDTACRRVADLLQQHRGLPIQHVGELNFD